MAELSLAAGTVLDLAPEAVVECADAAGYRLAGVRMAQPRAQAPAVARALARTGVRLLDVEVVRLAPGPLTDLQRRLADTAAALGAAHLLTVSEDPDEPATVAKVAELRELLRGSPTRVAVEPMVFTAVRTRADAERIARAVPGTSVLLDPLHLLRAGDRADRPADPGLTGYAQLTDTAEAAAPDDPAHEARHRRVPPGDGILDLAGFLGALPPGTPLACEVQSDRLLAEYDPVARAAVVRAAAERVLAGTPSGRG